VSRHRINLQELGRQPYYYEGFGTRFRRFSSAADAKGRGLGDPVEDGVPREQQRVAIDRALGDVSVRRRDGAAFLGEPSA